MTSTVAESDGGACPGSCRFDECQMGEEISGYWGRGGQWTRSS